MSDEIKHQSFSTGTQPFARTITEIRLRDDAQPSDFRVPLPGTKEAMTCGCTCPPQPVWPTVAFASDCPLHYVRVPRHAAIRSQ
jgi:hypothetical protein